MGIKAIRQYQTSDGKTHDTMQAAQRHEAQSKVFKAVKTVLDKASIQGMGMTHIDLVNKPELAIALRDALNKSLDFHRRYTGKVKKRINKS